MLAFFGLGGNRKSWLLLLLKNVPPLSSETSERHVPDFPAFLFAEKRLLGKSQFHRSLISAYRVFWEECNRPVWWNGGLFFWGEIDSEMCHQWMENISLKYALFQKYRNVLFNLALSLNFKTGPHSGKNWNRNPSLSLVSLSKTKRLMFLCGLCEKNPVWIGIPPAAALARGLTGEYNFDEWFRVESTLWSSTLLLLAETSRSEQKFCRLVEQRQPPSLWRDSKVHNYLIESNWMINYRQLN